MGLDNTMVAGLIQLLNVRRRGFFCGLCFIVLCYLLSVWGLHTRYSDSKSRTQTGSHTPAASDGAPALSHSFLHLLIPATKSDLNICKTILSAAVLNYSTPILINWDKKFENKSLSDNGSHLAKIPGILTYLNSLALEQDNDLVLIVDGFDTWFQLRPDILLSRYHALNNQANGRITRRLGASKSLPPISQQIIFSTQKLCWPHRPDELACFSPPPSTLDPHVFGPDTDVPFPDQENPHLRTRQRHMNSGLMLGTVHALKHFLKSAHAHMLEDPHQGSDQGVFSDLLGAQEYQRELLRQIHLSQAQKLIYWFRRVLGLRNEFERDRDALLLPHPARETMELVPDYTQAEFGVGLDYGNELSHATVFAERDADWVKFGKPREASRYWHVKSPNIGQLPKDIAMSAPPLERIHVEEKEGVDIGATWELVPLYTHLWTGNVPVSVHHNAWQHGLKTLRESMWTLLWWQPYAEKLLRLHIKSSRQPVAIDHYGMEWWSPVENKGGAQTDNGTWIGWKELCGNEEVKLFKRGQ